MATNFPNGVSSFGMLQMGGGAGTLPKMGGSGKVYFVDPANGSDDSTSGSTPDDAYDKVSYAEDQCVDKQGDVIYYLNDGNTTGSSRESTVITWDKDNTHLIGLCAPTMVSQRCRIVPPTSGYTMTANPMITVSGHGNIFANLQIANFGSTDGVASRGVDVTGNRNYFYNVHIVGIGHANAGDEAAEDLRLTGSENTFERCVFGVDTVARGNNKTNCCVRFGSGSNEESCRNVFRDCIFSIYCDDTEPIFIKIGAAFDTQRWNLFERCTFINTGTSTMAAGISHTAAAGKTLLKDCAFYGCTDVTAADSTDVYAYGPPIGASAVDCGLFKGIDIA